MSQVTLESFIGRSEDEVFEVKRRWPDLNSDRNKAEFLDDILSFANAKGGQIVFGLSEDSNATVSGLGETLSTSIDDAILQATQLIATTAEPPPIVSIDPIASSEGGFGISIRISRRVSGPCYNRKSNRFVIREGRAKRNMRYDEIKHAFLGEDRFRSDAVKMHEHQKAETFSRFSRCERTVYAYVSILPSYHYDGERDFHSNNVPRPRVFPYESNDRTYVDPVRCDLGWEMVQTSVEGLVFRMFVSDRGFVFISVAYAMDEHPVRKTVDASPLTKMLPNYLRVDVCDFIRNGGAYGNVALYAEVDGLSRWPKYQSRDRLRSDGAVVCDIDRVPELVRSFSRNVIG